MHCLHPLICLTRQRVRHVTLHITCRRGNYLCLVGVRALLRWILTGWVLHCATHLSIRQSGKTNDSGTPPTGWMVKKQCIQWAHWEWLRPFLDDEALDEVCQNTGLDHRLRGRGSVAMRDPTRPWKHRGGRGRDWGWSPDILRRGEGTKHDLERGTHGKAHSQRGRRDYRKRYLLHWDWLRAPRRALGLAGAVEGRGLLRRGLRYCQIFFSVCSWAVSPKKTKLKNIKCKQERKVCIQNANTKESKS